MSELPESPDPVEGPPEAALVAAPAGPGMALRQAREARGLTVADVVQALKFSARQIEALEADELSSLPGPVIVRGMVRSYARLLKLDPEPLLGLLASDAPASPPDVRPPDNMGTAMPRSGVRQVPLLVALSVLLLVGAATMGAWHLLAPTPLPAGLPVDSVVEPAAPVLPPQAHVEQPAAEAAEPVPAPAPTPDAAPVSPDMKQLVFEFRGVSWVEVKDAAARIILTGRYGAGSREAVSGRPPFQIVVGNAPEVALQYEDRVIDLKPHTRAEVARLSLE